MAFEKPKGVGKGGDKPNHAGKKHEGKPQQQQGKQQQGKQQQGKQQGKGGKGKGKGKPQEGDEYVVMVSNVEAEPALVLADAIPRFLMPRVPGEPNSKGMRFFAVNPDMTTRVRTETSTATVSFPAGSLTTMPVPKKAPKRPREEGGEGEEKEEAAEEEKPEEDEPQAEPTPLTLEGLQQYLKGKYLFGIPISVAAAGPEAETMQAQLAPAVATSSDAINGAALHKLLAPVPGFLACTKLREKRFRVVFKDLDALFAAKILLDEFEAEGTRVTLLLPDTQTDAFNAFVEKKANATEE